MDLVTKPVTTDCGHNFCLECLVSAAKSNVDQCPNCRSQSFNQLLSDQEQTLQYKQNNILQMILTEFGMYQ